MGGGGSEKVPHMFLLGALQDPFEFQCAADRQESLAAGTEERLQPSHTP